jgi:hypothetical protein
MDNKCKIQKSFFCGAGADSEQQKKCKHYHRQFGAMSNRCKYSTPELIPYCQSIHARREASNG